LLCQFADAFSSYLLPISSATPQQGADSGLDECDGNMENTTATADPVADLINFEVHAKPIRNTEFGTWERPEASGNTETVGVAVLRLDFEREDDMELFR
jgi:hypothetical protein